MKAASGPNLPRLIALKKRYDPTNFFRSNINIEQLGSGWRIASTASLYTEMGAVGHAERLGRELERVERE